MWQLIYTALDPFHLPSYPRAECFSFSFRISNLILFNAHISIVHQIILDCIWFYWPCPLPNLVKNLNYNKTSAFNFIWYPIFLPLKKFNFKVHVSFLKCLILLPLFSMCMKIWICQNLKTLNVPFVCIQGHLTNDTTRDEMYLIKLSSFFFTVAPLYNFPFINNSSKLFWSKSIPCLEYKFRCCYAV